MEQRHHQQSSIQVKHYSFPGPLLFWIPISLRILVNLNHPAALAQDVTPHVKVISHNGWSIEPCVVERSSTVTAADAASSSGSPENKAVFWYTFFIRPPFGIDYAFRDHVRLGISMFGGGGVLMEHQYPASPVGLPISHLPVCFFDAYVLSDVGGCQASTAPRSVPPELFNQQKTARSLTTDPELDARIIKRIHERGYEPGNFTFVHSSWRV
jgi:hypothetical protein